MLDEIQTQDEFNRLDVLAQSVPHEPVYGAYLVARRERLFELRAVGKAYPDRRLIDTNRIKINSRVDFIMSGRRRTLGQRSRLAFTCSSR